MADYSSLPNHLLHHILHEASKHLNSKTLAALHQTSTTTKRMVEKTVKRRKMIHKFLKNAMKSIAILEHTVSQAYQTIMGFSVSMVVNHVFREEQDLQVDLLQRLLRQLGRLPGANTTVTGKFKTIKYTFDKIQNTLFCQVNYPGGVTLIHKSEILKSGLARFVPSHRFWFMPIQRSVIVLTKNNAPLPGPKAAELIMALIDAKWPLPSGGQWNAIKANIQRRNNASKTSTVQEFLKSLNPGYKRPYLIN